MANDILEIKNQEIDDALDLIDLIGYGRSIKDVWVNSRTHSVIQFEGISDYEVVDIKNMLQDNGINTHFALPF